MPSEAGLAQLPAGLFQHCEIGSGPLSAIAKFTPPVSGSSDAFHQLHQVTAEVPDSTSSLQMSGRMGNQSVHNV